MTKEDYLIELNINENEDYETTLKVFLILRIIFSVIDYIIVILIVDNIGKIFLSIQKDGTPFTESNLKCLNRINIFAAILCVFGLGRFAIGLLPLIIIFAITYIFRNGCKLQQQADETI